MKRIDLELAVGIFLLIGIAALGYLSIKLGRLDVVGKGYYTVYADFENAGGIKQGSSVEIAGVEVGKVKTVRLDNYQARAELTIDSHVKIQQDSVASVRTKGLIGEKFILITPGGSETFLPNGGRIRETESSIDVEELISKYVFGKV
jgi:phospholipid/cholesterol/gamma-HCH transport system substrate-binding protein